MESVVAIPPLLAKALKLRRQVLGLTQIQAARRAGLLAKTVSALENHPERASLDSLFKLLAALGLELALRPRAARTDRSSW